MSSTMCLDGRQKPNDGPRMRCGRWQTMYMHASAVSSPRCIACAIRAQAVHTSTDMSAESMNPATSNVPRSCGMNAGCLGHRTRRQARSATRGWRTAYVTFKQTELNQNLQSATLPEIGKKRQRCVSISRFLRFHARAKGGIPGPARERRVGSACEQPASTEAYDNGHTTHRNGRC